MIMSKKDFEQLCEDVQKKMSAILGKKVHREITAACVAIGDRAGYKDASKIVNFVNSAMINDGEFAKAAIAAVSLEINFAIEKDLEIKKLNQTITEKKLETLKERLRHTQVVTKMAGEIANLRDEVAALKASNERLKTENDELRGKNQGDAV